MKRILILLLSLVFIVAMTGCKSALIPADTADTPDTVDTAEVADTVEPVDIVDSNPPTVTVQTAALAGSYSLTLDVNPSIELKVQDGLVTGAAAYNDDGQAILLSASVTGLSVNGAIDAIIAEIAAAGYLNAADKEPYVLLTVTGGEENPELCEELQEYTEEALEGAGVESEVKSVAVPSEITDGAAAKGMSSGRYMVLQYIANEKGITFEEAAALYGTMSIGQLMEQFEDLDEAFDEDGDNDIEDTEDEDADDQGEDADDQDGVDATSGATINPDGSGSGGQTGQDGQVSGDDEDENDDEDGDNDQDDDQDDDENEDGNGGGDEGGNED